MEEIKRRTGNLISDLRYYGQGFIPGCIDRKLAKWQFRLFGL